MKMCTLKLVLHSTVLVLLQTFFSPALAQRYFRDPSFNNNWYTTNAHTRVTEVLPNDKILVAGNFIFYDKNFNAADPGGVAVHQIIRLKSNGKLDKTFNGPALNGNKNIYTITSQSDDKILIGGDFVINATKPDGVTVSYTNVARLLPDGDLDYTFNPGGGGTNGPVRKILVKEASTDGVRTILIGGIYSSYKSASILVNGRQQGGLIEVNEQGHLVRNWEVMDDDCCTSGGVWDMAFTKDNKVVIGGEFGMIGTQVVRRLARLNRADGSLDPTFYIDRYGPSAGIYTVAVQADNKILYGGATDDASGYPTLTHFIGGGITPGDYWTRYPRHRIGRLKADGKLDPTFNPDGDYFTGPKDSVLKIMIARDGKILLGGRFSSYQGHTVGNIVRLKNQGAAGLPDGTFDETFNTGTGFNRTVFDLNFQSKGSDPEAHIIASGDFIKFDTYETDPIAQGYVMRLLGGISLPVLVADFSTTKLADNKVLIKWKGMDENAIYELQRSTNGRSFTTLAVFQSHDDISYIDNIKEEGLLYYRIGVKRGSDYLGFSQVNRIASTMPYSTNVHLSNNKLSVTVSSATIKKEKLTLSIVTLSGQQIVNETFSMNGKHLEANLSLQQLLKNCLIILRNEAGETIYKTLYQ